MWSWSDLKDGDQKSRERFAVEFGPYITARLRSLGFRREDAEDCAADGLIAVLGQLSKFEPRDPVEPMFRAWAWTVAYHVAESWRRDYRPHILDPLPEYLPDPEGSQDDYDPIEAQERKARDEEEKESRVELLKAMVNRLPEKYRQIIENKAFGGDSTFEQVGAVLRISAGTARQRYHRAVRILRRIALDPTV